MCKSGVCFENFTNFHFAWRTLGSGYNVSSQEVHEHQHRKGPVSYRLSQSAVDPSHRRYICVTKLVCCFSKALRLVEKLNNEAVSENCSGSREAFSVTHFQNAFFSSADEHHVLLYIKALAAHTESRKQTGIFNGRGF